MACLAKIARTTLLATIILILSLPSTVVLAADPVIATDVATDVTESTAVFNAAITDYGTFAGPNVYLFFEYSTDAYYDAYTGYDRETTEQEWPISNGLTTFAVQIEGLAHGTEYHYRAVLRYGTDYIYGLDQTFITTMVYPDRTPEIHSMQAYQDLLEADDCLFVILAEIPYADIPEVPVNRSYLWSLMDTGVEEGWNVGYAMNENGYNFNIYSLYFPAAATIDWGNATDYNVQLSGSPSVFSGVVPTYDNADAGSYAVTADTWVTSSDYSADLAEDLLDLASTLEQEWQLALLDEQDTKTVLSGNGEKLFRNAIPGIQSMAPSLFFVQEVDMSVSPRAWGTSLDTTYQERLLGADGVPGGGDDHWIAGSIIGVADWLNIPWLLFMGMLCAGACVFVIYKSNKKWHTAVPGYVASLLIVMCFALLSLGMTVVAIIAIVLVIVAGWFAFMRRAS